MRYFIRFSYRGTSYHGWQYQPNAITVQEVLEEKMSILLGETVKLVAAGRTDAGVHAKCMIAHFDSERVDMDSFIFRMNAFLPSDIAILELHKVKDDAHARFDAIERTYLYYINYHKNPFTTDLSWQWNYAALNIKKMNQAATELLSYSDFTSFAKLHADNKTNLCKVGKAVWKETKDGLIFEISADRFLRNMVRSIVGTLVEVGQEKISLSQFKEIIEKKDRKFAAASAPAHGLYLCDIAYPKEVYI